MVSGPRSRRIDRFQSADMKNVSMGSRRVIYSDVCAVEIESGARQRTDKKIGIGKLIVMGCDTIFGGDVGSGAVAVGVGRVADDVTVDGSSWSLQHVDGVWVERPMTIMGLINFRTEDRVGFSCFSFSPNDVQSGSCFLGFSLFFLAVVEVAEALD
ncbi:UNVERIFIED_CONTAM: hypothetical protein K2H54_046073 [Gekko kuhli]